MTCPQKPVRPSVWPLDEVFGGRGIHIAISILQLVASDSEDLLCERVFAVRRWQNGRVLHDEILYCFRNSS